MDFLGWLLRHTPSIKGKRRLAWYWMAKRDTFAVRRTTLPGSTQITCDLSIPYEAMVWLGMEESGDLKIVQRLLRPGATFVDCGANIGLWTLVCSTAVGKNGHVFAFEPNPTTADKLQLNAAINMRQNIEVVRSVVAAKSGTANFRCMNAHNVSEVAQLPDSGTIVISATTLDEQLGDRFVHGIKIDVEGHELQVLLGATNVIEHSSPWLCIEFNTIASGVSQLGEWEVHRYLVKRGYSAWLMSDALRRDRVVALSESWKTSGYCNLFYSRDKNLKADHDPTA
jgi:FkbM family methyltransferase